MFDDKIITVKDVPRVMIPRSPRYMKSEWYLRELNEFTSLHIEDGGIKVGEKSRIFKVTALQSILMISPTSCHQAQSIIGV